MATTAIRPRPDEAATSTYGAIDGDDVHRNQGTPWLKRLLRLMNDAIVLCFVATCIVGAAASEITLTSNDTIQCVPERDVPWYEPCLASPNCIFVDRGNGVCSPGMTSLPPTDTPHVASDLAKRRCSVEFVSTVQPGRTYKYFGTYEPAWAAHSTCFDRCGENGCSINYEREFDGTTVWYGNIVQQKVYGRMTQSVYPPDWRVRNGICDGFRIANKELEKKETDYYRVEYNGVTNWRPHEEWRGLDWMQVSYFTKTSCEDGKVYWHTEGYAIWESNTRWHDKYNHALCDRFGDLLGLIAGQWLPVVGGMLGKLISTRC